MRRYLIIWIVLISSVYSSLGDEIAYVMGPNGEKDPVGQANITEFKSLDDVAFTVSADRGLSEPSVSYKGTRTIDSIKDEINKKVNRGNDQVRDEGLSLAGSISGAQRIDQVCSVYNYMVGNWTFVSDWKGLDLFQYSNYTLKKSGEIGSAGKGDCDDFSILLASLVESIGGTPRIIFAYSPDGGHAYTEVYLGKKDDRDVERMLRWLRTAYRVDNLYVHEDSESGDLWLNMDWWKEPGGANHPGGPFFEAETHIPVYIQADEDKTQLTAIENLLPNIILTFNPAQPEVDEAVCFDASESADLDGTIVDYEWDFGDGDISRGVAKSKVRHSYAISGRFLANLTVTDNEGDKNIKSSEIEIIEPLPEAIGTYSPANPKVGEVITFDASQSKNRIGEIIKYEWDFDDGYSGKRVSIDHSYFKIGLYNVKLTVTNENGATNSSFIKVNVAQKAAQTMPPIITEEFTDASEASSASSGNQLMSGATSQTGYVTTSRATEPSSGNQLMSSATALTGMSRTTEPSSADRLMSGPIASTDYRTTSRSAASTDFYEVATGNYTGNYTTGMQKEMDVYSDTPATIQSQGMRGYQVYLDEVYIGTEGTGGDALDGIFKFMVSGGQNHNIRVYDGQFNYPKTMFFERGVPKIINVDPGTSVYF